MRKASIFAARFRKDPGVLLKDAKRKKPASGVVEVRSDRMEKEFLNVKHWLSKAKKIV